MMVLVLVIACICNAVVAVVAVTLAPPPEQYLALINAAVSGCLISAIERNLRDGR